MKGIRWVVLAILVLGSAIAYVLRTNFNIVSETMMHDLGMNEYQLGMVFSAFAAGYAIFQFPGGIFGHRYGPRFTITLIAVIWTILSLITAVIPGNDVLSVATIVVALIVTRFLVGAFHAPFFPVTIGGTIASWFPLRQWGLSNGLTSTGLTLGAAATAPVIVWLMDAYGWRSALLITAPVGLLFAVIFRWYVTDDPKDHPDIRVEELDLIASDRPAGGQVPIKGAWKVALRNRNVLLITGSYFCMNYLFYLFFSWFFFYLTDIKGLSNTDAGMFVSAQWILGAVGATAGGIICDFLVRRLGVRSGPKILAMAGLIFSAVFLYLGAVSANPILSVGFLCLSFACNQMTEAPIWVATMAVSGRHAAVATGILNTGANLPGVLGGLLVPVTAGLFGWPAAMATGSIFAIIGALLWLFIRADEPMSEKSDG
jgi:ACS family glucarate transporter-like MFS transporter